MKLIQYDELTWLEVAALPRDIPLVVPIGLDKYEFNQLAGDLKVERLVILPPIPYGFHQQEGNLLSNMAVRPGLFRRVMFGIQHELKTQGFKHIVFGCTKSLSSIKTKGLNIVPINKYLPSRDPFLANLKGRVVIISTGHTEQHGHHLPLSTDTLIVEALAAQLQNRIPDRVACLPVWPFGVSTHTRQFPATLNLGGRVFEDFFLAIIDQLVDAGAEMIYFSNGHGGNHSFLVNVVKYAGERYPNVFIATEWLHTSASAVERYRQSARGGMGHGGELETSYILHLRPDLVHMDRATTETDFISTENYYMDWVEGGRMIANPPWTDDTRSGIYGDGRLGTAEKGRLWLEAAVLEKIGIIAEIQEQHNRRQQKRKQLHPDFV